MCGLCGFIAFDSLSKLSNYQDKRNFMEQMLHLSALRGKDGTGLAIIQYPEETPEVYKKALSSPDFLEMPTTKRLLWRVDAAAVVLGHTRAATKGTINDENAHPFTAKHITLAHNGHITNFKSLLKQNSDVPDVDSAYVAWSMALAGEKETLERIHGDYVLMWHNSQDGTFNVAKNSGRPLFWINVPDWKGVAFASEIEFLGTVLGRNRIRTQDVFRYPNIHVHYKIDLNVDKFSYTEIPFQESIIGTTGPPSEKKKLVQVNDEALISRLIEKYKGKTNSSGRPTSRKGLRRAIASVRRQGLEYDCCYGVEFDVFVPYKGQKTTGCVMGHMKGINEKKNIEVHSITKDEYDALSKLSLIIAKPVDTVYYQKLKEHYIIMELDSGTMADMYKKMNNEPRKETSSTLPAIATFRGPRGVYFGLDDWKKLVEDGCSVCGQDCEPKEAESMIWFGSSFDCPICHTCAVDPSKLKELGIIVN